MKRSFDSLKQLRQALVDLEYLLGSIKLNIWVRTINSQEKSISDLLERNQQMSMKNLSETLNYKFSTMTGIIDRLEKNGLVERKPSKTDRRTIMVSLKDDWRKEYKIYVKERERVAKLIMELLTEEKFETLVQLLSETNHCVNEIISDINKIEVDSSQS